MIKLKQVFLLIILYASVTLFAFNRVIAAEHFIGRVNSENINIRSDANTTSAVITNAAKNDEVEVILEKYDWYKIKLPKTSALFVKKDFFEPVNEIVNQAVIVRTAKAIKDNINARLTPAETSSILGRISKNEVVNVLGDKGGWYKIEPTATCYGWMHKKFIDKLRTIAEVKIPKENLSTAALATSQKPTEQSLEIITIEGTVQPYGKVINRIATHKLITKNFDTFLLKGNPDNLNDLIYHKIKVTARRIANQQEQKYPVIEIIKLEALD